jgi:WhiB family transcriptional regulator, redox-sensing transcriptional regulator
VNTSPWREQISCSPQLLNLFGLEPDDFFPLSTHTVRGAELVARAKTVCAGCPVKRQCLDDAMDNGLAEGIFGGLTADERRNLRRNSEAVA